MAIILSACGPCVVIVNCWHRFCTLGRAPLVNETLPDFREWCRVTRHPRVLCGLTGCQRTPGKWGVTILVIFLCYKYLLCNICREIDNIGEGLEFSTYSSSRVFL